MDSQHKAMRAQLSSMAPKRAIAYILSFELPEDEAACIIECDVRRKSCVQVAMEHNLSVDAVKKYRQRAYHKISSDQHEKRNCLTKW
jgi:DNA-directed RNA polymerase specialized sigma24 family protein|uniref:ECF sigma factor n=1 Tax=Siphoviridae sp. ctnhN1 TaxID=2827589 RepID=A0A8S5LKT2_9CAUD|nr:MAG TPA: ECF sigma factor [Siphoviridae sp. ctnhN1]